MAIVFWLGFCGLVGYFANKKGRNPVGWGALAFVISPLLAGIALAIVKDLTVDEKLKDIDQKTDNLKTEMEYNQKYNDLRSEMMDKRISEGNSNGQKSSRQLSRVDQSQKTLPSNKSNSNIESVADELSKLHKLKNNGVLTEEEFNIQKRKILDRT